MDSLQHHRLYLDGEWRALQAAPLSTRKAMLVALLVDSFVDRLFASDAAATDILAYRAAMAAFTPALGRVLALAERRSAVVTEAVAVPLADYGELPVADFMVSLYNGHSVMRLLVASPDGARHDLLETLGEAIAALDRHRARSG